MRFTSLIVELLRARPLLIFWIAVLSQALLWFVVPMVLYGSPPGEMPTVIAFGREYQVGTDLGPPLAFWAADIAFRLAGDHIFGVYLLSQLCFVVTFFALFKLGRAIVGPQHALLAVLLAATVTVFSFPGIEFGPFKLAQPLWALTLLHAWRIMGQGRRNAWFALSVDIGLLLLTTAMAWPLVVLLIAFALATARGRQALKASDPLLSLMVILVALSPYLLWMTQAGAFVRPALPPIGPVTDALLRWGTIVGHLLFAMFGIVLLAIFNSRYVNRKPEDAPVIFRAPVTSFARQFVYFFAIAPAVVLSLMAAVLGSEKFAGSDGIALLLPPLAVIVASADLIYLRQQRVLRVVWLVIVLVPAAFLAVTVLILPWVGGTELRTSLPANAIGQFFGESFERRFNRPLPAVAGDPELSTLIGMAASGRPHVLFDNPPYPAPDLTPEKINETGGIVVWRALDTAGLPPPEILKKYPSLVPEVPRAFERLIRGRQPLLRIGWAVIRPK